MLLVDELPKRGARVSMIPLIDTMFLLLAFFVVAILAMEFLQGVPVDLAAASTATTPESNGIFVTITKEEAVFVDGDLVEPAALVQRIRARGESGDAGPVLISADTGVRFESVLDLLDRLREARVEQVFLQTKRESP